MDGNLKSVNESFRMVACRIDTIEIHEVYDFSLNVAKDRSLLLRNAGIGMEAQSVVGKPGIEVIIDRSADIVLAEDNCHTMRRNRFYDLSSVVTDTMAVNDRNLMTWICLVKLLLITKGTSLAVGESSVIIGVRNTADIWLEVIDDEYFPLRNASLGM